MFIEIENKKGVFGNLGGKQRRLNINSVDIIEFDERKMFLDNGRPMPHITAGRYSNRDMAEMVPVKIIIFKKWSKNTNSKPDDYTLYFTSEGVEDYNRIKTFIDKQTETF